MQRQRWAGRGRHVKAARVHAILETAGAIPQRAMGCPSTAGGGGRQADGAMAAVSGAPLTVSSYTCVLSTLDPTTSMPHL
jgi:hypothetical protein